MEPRPFDVELVLVGAGHAHLAVLASFAMNRPPANVTLVVDVPLAVYSGMVPGLVAGRHRAEDVAIDALPLARACGARVVLARMVAIDPTRRVLEVEGRPAIPYDVASLDLGASVAGLDTPGVRDFALATRPIGRFVEALGEADESLRRRNGDCDVVVVGGGAAGIEIAAAMRARATGLGLASSPRIRLVHGAARLLAERSEGLSRRAAAALAERAIVVEHGARVTAVDRVSVTLTPGGTRPCDFLLWATGAAAHRDVDVSALPLDSRGFVEIAPTFEVVGHPGLFAAGDMATFVDFPWVPRAGVHAVRAGAPLARNLRRALVGAALERHQPQRHFLALLDLGDGSALGERNGVSFGGRWVRSLKDHIDRRFVRRYQLLDGEGVPREAMSVAAPMVCGGCAAKLATDVLEGVLGDVIVDTAIGAEVLLGPRDADDVVAWRSPAGDVIASNVDLLRPFTNDPWLVGRVAARNALSDLEAKGITPRHAQAIVCLPIEASDLAAARLLREVLLGAQSVLVPAGVGLLGGHTARAAELLVGFVVDGVATSPPSRRRGPIEVGDRLVLTRRLGTGVVFHADMAGRARGPWVVAAHEAIDEGNSRAGAVLAAAALAGCAVRASTDVTGFGLLGHLLPMLAGQGVTAVLDLEVLPTIPGAIELLQRGERSTFHAQNARALDAVANTTLADPARLALLADPQTAGGLLLVVAAQDHAGLLARFAAAAVLATSIGVLHPLREDGFVVEVDSDGPRRPQS